MNPILQILIPTTRRILLAVQLYYYGSTGSIVDLQNISGHKPGGLINKPTTPERHFVFLAGTCRIL
eukprot:SAG11_NODE_8775_length_977_cov_4.580866_1_plen_66_part_00